MRSFVRMNFEACLALPHNRREAGLIADNLEALARALREWPAEAWAQVETSEPKDDGLFERLIVRAAPAAADPRTRAVALASAEAVADVLRVLWPARQATASRPQQLVTASS